MVGEKWYINEWQTIFFFFHHSIRLKYFHIIFYHIVTPLRMKTIKSLSFKSGKKLAFSSPLSRSFGTTLPVYSTFLSSKKTIHRSFHGYFHSSSPASFLLSQSVNPTNNRCLQKYYSGKNLTTLSHLSEDGRHTNMVDITSKSESYREAHAQAKVSLPSFIIDKIREKTKCQRFQN